MQNVFIGVGNLDFLLSPQGCLFVLQNVTWGGKQGFQSRPDSNQFYVPYHPEYNGGALSSSGDVGNWGSERGLTFYQVQLSGHGKSLSNEESSVFYFCCTAIVYVVTKKLLIQHSNRTTRICTWGWLPDVRGSPRPHRKCRRREQLYNTVRKFHRDEHCVREFNPKTLTRTQI